MLSEAALNYISKVGIPPHDLRIKKNDIMFLQRNLNINDGICNNSRVQVLNIRDNIVVVKLLDGTDRIVVIPRIRFIFRVQHGHSFEMIREQFPLRRAYAMTFNKSEGQTLNKVVLDLRGNLFAHGFLYVGLSRVSNSRNIYLYGSISQLFFSKNDEVLEEFNGGMIVNNVVYTDMIKMFDVENTLPDEDFEDPSEYWSGSDDSYL
jgi:hypothetical protein